MNELQRSETWFQNRLGKITASRVSEIMAKGRDGKSPSASRENYLAELLLERLTGQHTESYTSPAMLKGIELEDEAKRAYENKYFVSIEDVGLIDHPTIPMFGASPDGLISDDGGIECKCPEPKAHFQTIMTGKIKREYLLQIMTGMICSGRKWWDYVSYNPHFPDNLKLIVIRVEYDEKLAVEIEQEVKAFLSDLDAALEAVKLKQGVM